MISKQSIVVLFIIVLFVNHSASNTEVLVFGVNFSRYINIILLASISFYLFEKMRDVKILIFVSIAILTKILYLVGIDSLFSNVIYRVFYLVLVYTFAVYISLHSKAALMKSMHILFIINFVFLIGQLFNLSPLFQVLTTHGDKVFTDLLFVDQQYAPYYSVIQSKPSGILHANNVTSGFIGFIFVLNMAKKKPNFYINIMVVLSVVVCGARTSLLILIVYVTIYLIKGNKHQRQNAIVIPVLYALSVVLYSRLFPTLYTDIYNIDSFMYSLWVRLNNLIGIANEIIALDYSILELNQYKPTQIVYVDNQQVVYELSGIATIIKYYKISFLVILIGLYISLKRYKINKKIYSRLMIPRYGIYFLLLYPLGVPTFASELYWFFCGCFFVYPFLNIYGIKKLNLKEVQIYNQNMKNKALPNVQFGSDTLAIN